MSSPIVPCLRYRNAPQMIEWLCENLGFTKHMIYPGENNTIAHAQLTLGSGMIMVSSITDTPFGKFLQDPAEIGGRETQCCFIQVQDVEHVYEKVVANGGKILLPLKDQDYGSRDFTFSDPAGHIWSIGTYDPWKS